MACPYVDLIELPRKSGPGYVCRAPVRQGPQVPRSAASFRDWCLGDGYAACPRYQRVIARDGEEVGIEPEPVAIVPGPGEDIPAGAS